MAPLKHLFLALALFATLVAVSMARAVDTDAPEYAFRQKREHGDSHGVVGPVHTYVKTDKHANFKWGVRHHVGHKYA